MNIRMLSITTFMIIYLLSAPVFAQGGRRASDIDKEERRRRAILKFQDIIYKAREAGKVEREYRAVSHYRDRRITRAMVNAVDQQLGNKEVVEELLDLIVEYGDPWAAEHLERVQSRIEDPELLVHYIETVRELDDYRSDSLYFQVIERKDPEFKEGVLLAAESLADTYPLLWFEDIRQELKRQLDRRNRARERGDKKRVDMYNGIIEELKRALREATGADLSSPEEWKTYQSEHREEMSEKQEERRKEVKKKFAKRLSKFARD